MYTYSVGTFDTAAVRDTGPVTGNSVTGSKVEPTGHDGSKNTDKDGRYRIRQKITA